MPCDAQARHVDVLCFTVQPVQPVQPVAHLAGESHTDSAVQPVAVEADAENDEDDVHSNSSEENNILDDSGAPEDAPADRLETHTAAQPVQSQSVADIKNEDAHSTQSLSRFAAWSNAARPG